MRKQLLLASTVLLLFTSNIALADTKNLDAATIQQVHKDVKLFLAQQCKKDIPKASDETCNCLGERAQANLDDEALAKCPNNPSGEACIATIVSDANAIATNKESMDICKPQAVAQAQIPTAMPAQVLDPSIDKSSASSASNDESPMDYDYLN